MHESVRNSGTNKTFFVSKVKAGTFVEEFVKYVKRIFNGAEVGVRKLADNEVSKAFKLTVPDEVAEVIMKAELRPEGIRPWPFRWLNKTT